MSREVLFETPHGSRLYGTAHSLSDHDTYRVVAKLPNIYEIRPKKYSKQDLRGLDDVVTVDFSTWTRLCWEGVPQAIEAMFSQVATIDHLAAYRAAYRVGSAVVPTYLRTIRGFAYKGEHDRKFRRHAARLAVNVHDLRRLGRFNPTMEPDEVERLYEIAEWETDSTGWSDPVAFDSLLREIALG